ncbi:hypothetical protein [Sphingomonas phyllosphaerae]|uniref:hypothetical protein n=1 Tax=Sphingomonas phyllosphaerae TaxID=257003 RepID=UPI0012DCD189|nr:hypothetical protein [Sphingomonas phyllosphaerae]
MYPPDTHSRVRLRPIADIHISGHHAPMKPDRYEWLRAEEARIEKEGTGSNFVRHVLAEHTKRMLGFSLVALPAVCLIAILPRRMDGALQPAPLFATGAALASLSVILWKWQKPVARVSRWSTWTTFGVGILFCLVALAV